eukprot:GGOE01003969.1.p1 GENE.GGOE01003969.1~~GGOE01003969.1.p1  ORF type:complete len:798 (+),score=145.61 GGOE01003969.1:51-2396(+)
MDDLDGLLSELEALAERHGLPQLQAAWAVFICRHRSCEPPVSNASAPEAPPGYAGNAETQEPDPCNNVHTVTDAVSSQPSTDGEPAVFSEVSRALWSKRCSSLRHCGGSAVPRPIMETASARAAPLAPPSCTSKESTDARQAPHLEEGDGPGVGRGGAPPSHCPSQEQLLTDDSAPCRPQTRSLTRQASRTEAVVAVVVAAVEVKGGGSPSPRPSGPDATAPPSSEGVAVQKATATAVVAEADNNSQPPQAVEAEEPIGRRTRSSTFRDPDEEGSSASQSQPTPPTPPPGEGEMHPSPVPASTKRRRQSQFQGTGTAGTSVPSSGVERQPKRARKSLGRASVTSKGCQTTLPFDTQRYVANFCQGSELWSLYRVSSKLRMHISSTPGLKLRLDNYRLRKVWNCTALPLRTRAHQSHRLTEQKDNVRDVFAADHDLLFVQLSDGRRWNAAKAGRRLEVGIVATSVNDSLSYAVSSLWEYALAVPLSDTAPRAPTRDFRRMHSATCCCSFEHSKAPVLTVRAGQTGPDEPQQSGVEFQPTASSPGLQPLTALRLDDGGVTLRWLSGRFEFVCLEGDHCAAVVRSPGAPAELAVLHLPTLSLSRMAVSQALAYSTKVVRVVEQRVFLISFEFTGIWISTVNPDGQLDAPQLLSEEKCSQFMGFTEDAVVLRSRACFQLVQLPDGLVQASLPITRLGIATVGAAAYHHPSKRLLVYDGAGTLLEAPLLASPPATAAALSEERPLFPVFQCRPRRTHSANPAVSAPGEATAQDEPMNDQPALRFST